ncbi:MAG: hypothetical protein IJP29_06255 [Lachnospiraceae bacterium]|nr:hypothetical protein [Lachnospiraceae bacterium]
MGADTPVYKISCSNKVLMSEFDEIISGMKDENFPDVVSCTCFINAENGMRIAGSTQISPKDFSLTGAWVEGYALPIPTDERKVCAVNERVLFYDERIKMTGELFEIEEEKFIIRGVYESFGGATDALIFIDTFKDMYGCFDSVWITFQEQLDEGEQQQFEKIVKQHIEHGSITYPKMSSDEGMMITASNQLQYSIFIVLLVLFLVSIIQYWYDVNISTYTIYWITGASNKKILAIVFCETLLLCISTFVVGLMFNAIFRTMLTRTAPLVLGDVVLGFGIFFGTMLMFSLINMIRICRTFSVNNIRRD